MTEHPSHTPQQNRLEHLGPKEGLMDTTLDFGNFGNGLMRAANRLSDTLPVQKIETTPSTPVLQTSGAGASADLPPRRFHKFDHTDAIQAEWEFPRRKGFEDYLGDADKNLTAATEVEMNLGLETATPFYEKAMSQYLAALGSSRGEELEGDFAFMLKLGSSMAKSASYAPPYEKKASFPIYDSEGDVEHIRGLNRKEDLFYSANNCFRQAWNIVGGVENAPVEIAAPLATEEAEMHILSGEPKKARDILVEAKEKLSNNTDPELRRVIDEQITDAELIMVGKEPVHSDTATNLLASLAHA